MTALALDETAHDNPHRRAALLMLAGQLSYIAATQFHAGGDANDHHAIFATYADDAFWSAVHVVQFASMALLIAGLLAFFDAHRHALPGLSRLGRSMAIVTLGLYAVLQAVDGVALKQAVVAWHMASAAEETARFAAAETVRWLEWGVRSYQDYALGITLLLVAIVSSRSTMPRPIGYLAGLSGLTYVAQGWVAVTVGFTPSQSIAIVIGWLASLAWIIWLALVRGPSAPARAVVAA